MAPRCRTPFWLSLTALSALLAIAGYAGQEMKKKEGTAPFLMLYVLCWLLWLPSFVACVSAAGTVWGYPDMGRQTARRVAVEILLGSAHVIPSVWHAYFTASFFHFSPVSWLTMMTGTAVAGTAGRRWTLRIVALEHIARPIFSDSFLNEPALLFVFGGIWWVASYTRYAHDQRLVVWSLLIQKQAFSVGSLLATGRHQGLPLSLAYTAVGTYAVYLMQRRSRALPPGLLGTHFVRLGFLRRMVEEGLPVQRCQLLPADAFGDPAKAAHLVVVSHRWLCRDSCDVATEEFPVGLRLQTMLQRLEAEFAPQPISSRSLRRFYQRHLVGGWDVVLFFDFMSLPQEPRTRDDEDVFRHCLPNMTVLYSMFPVLCLREVPPGRHGYFQSGWCYSEFTTAVLGGQLDRYSAEVVPTSHRGAAPESTTVAGSRSNGRGSRSATIISTELQSKHFREEEDRELVRNILHAFFLKRLLLDAVTKRALRTVVNLLDLLEARDMLKLTLDQPVDGNLSTLLHVAVAGGSSDLVRVLLDRGASRQLRNLLGDKPTEVYGVFRFWSRAACACASSRTDTGAGHVEVELPKLQASSLRSLETFSTTDSLSLCLANAV